MIQAPTGPQPPRTNAVILPTLTDVANLTQVGSDVREAERYAEIDLGDSDLEFWSFTDCEFRQTGLDNLDLSQATVTRLAFSRLPDRHPQCGRCPAGRAGSIAGRPPGDPGQRGLSPP